MKNLYIGVVLLFCLGTSLAVIRGGVLDSTFDEDGILVGDAESFGDTSFAYALDTDELGRTTIAGYHQKTSRHMDKILVARFEEDGSLDVGFGAAGVSGIEDLEGRLYGILRDGENRVLVAGGSYEGSPPKHTFTVARFTSDGRLDSSFNNSGIWRLRGEESSIARSLAIDSQKNIVVAGRVFRKGDWDIGIVKLDERGNVIPHFGEDGVATLEREGNENAYAVVTDTEDRIVLTGTSTSVEGEMKLSVSRLHTDGWLDASFNGGTVSIAEASEGRAIAIDKKKRIVVTGRSQKGSNNHFAAVRLQSNGKLDPSFDNDGVKSHPIGGYGYSWSHSVCLDTQGRILSAGRAYVDEQYNFAIVRYLENGQLDSSFDSDGTLTMNMGFGPSFARATGLDPQGRILVGGYARSSEQNYQLSLIRLLP